MGITCQSKIRVQFDSDETLDAQSCWRIYADGDAAPVDAGPIRSTLDRVGRRGFGVGRFGRGKFGRGAALVVARTRPMADGSHSITVKASDAAGNESTASGPATIVLAGTPRPPTALAPDAYVGGVLSMKFQLSQDDEAA